MQPDQRMPSWAHHQHAEFNVFLKELVSNAESLFSEPDLNNKAVLLSKAMEAYVQLKDRARRFNFFLKVAGLDADWKMLDDERHDLLNQNIAVEWPTSANLLNVLFVDTETTGLGQEDQPISLGAILVAVNKETGRVDHEIGNYYGLRAPTCEMKPGAFRVHGLREVDLLGKDFDYFHISAMLGVADVVVAHNAAFDKRMLRFLNIPDSRWACSCYDIDWPVNLKSRKLDTLCMGFGIQREYPHNALSDTQAMIAATQALRPSGMAYLSDITSRR